VEIGHHQKYFAAERFEAAAGVAGAVLQDRLADRIGDARLEFLEAGVLASDALTRDKTDALPTARERHDQVRQEGRIVLSVAVKRRHDRTAGATHAASDRGRLTRRFFM